MSRYIDADKVITGINNAYCSFGSGDVRWGFDIAKGIVEKAPTADVQEVKHGKWKYEDLSYCCSECGAISFNNDNFCHACGAKMDGDEK